MCFVVKFENAQQYDGRKIKKRERSHFFKSQASPRRLLKMVLTDDKNHLFLYHLSSFASINSARLKFLYHSCLGNIDTPQRVLMTSMRIAKSGSVSFTENLHPYFFSGSSSLLLSLPMRIGVIASMT